MKTVSISVVIAAYNRGARIGRTLDSVLGQSRPVDEIVVSDDQSTDGTAEWIRGHYPTVRVVTWPNAGTSMARNRGAAATMGDVLVFLDHDDEMSPHAVATLTGMLERFPEAQAAFADHTLQDVRTGESLANHHTSVASFHRMRTIPVLRSISHERLYGRDMWYALLRGNLLQQPWAIYKRAFDALGGFDPEIKYCEDWEMYLRVANRFPLVVSDTVIAHHFIEGANLHQASGQEIQHMKVVRKHLRRTRWTDLRAHLVLRRRLGSYLKNMGDHVWAERPRQAWFAYLRSFVTWPFDPVVVARCVIWSPLSGWALRRVQ
jgi:glycosyltransferase involved in cell wall biosynthesis